MSHTGLIDRHYITRKVVIRDITILLLSLMVYWTNAFVEDADNHRVSCSRTDCTFEAPMLTEGANTGLTYASNSTSDRSFASGYTTLYYFKATGTGTLIVTDSGDDGSTSDDTYGALFNADMSSTLTTNDSGNSNCFKFTYNVTEGQVYWIGARAYHTGTKYTNHTLTITGEWPHPIASATITDGEEYDGSLAYQQAATFTYKRNFANTTYNALYVPFAMSYSDWSEKADVYRLLNIFEEDEDDNGTIDKWVLKIVKLKAGESIKANTPYIIKAKATGEMEITLSNVLLASAQEKSIWCASTDYKFVFTGTYAQKAITADKEFFMSTTGALQYAASDCTLNPQRWYMGIYNKETDALVAPSTFNTTSSPSKAIVISCDDEDVTGIDEVSGFKSQVSGKFIENGKVVIIRNGKKYNLNGQVIK